MLGLGNSITSGVASSEWTPANISSLIHWYKYNTGITLDGENDVTVWADQKGSNNLTSVGDPSTQSPTFDSTKNAVHFNATGDILTFGTNLDLGTFSIYVRCEMEDFDGDFLFEETAADFWKIHDASTIRVKINNGARHDISSGVTLEPDTKFSIGLEREDTASSDDDRLAVYVDGSGLTWDSGDGTQNISEQFELKKVGQPATGVRFYEIILCNDALSASDRANLQIYLASI
tara:strand:- start:673 stop:1371 length:699 start_codon:yes stop_codon:yes gene_type:complete